MDDGSTEHTAVAIPEDNKLTMEDEFATLIVSYKDPVLADLDTNDEVNLAQFEQMETNAFQKEMSRFVQSPVHHVIHIILSKLP